jgi:WD40 repeat protein
MQADLTSNSLRLANASPGPQNVAGLRLADTFKYDAFISYSHDARQKAITSRLQRSLEQFAKPFWRRRALTLFRDEANLSANPDLWGTIEGALGQARQLILIASPEAAASKWVYREVDWWLRHRRADSLLIVLTAGNLTWAGDGFAVSGSDALPLPLLDAFRREPLWVDLTGIDPSLPGDGWRGAERFIGAVASLASALRGVPKDNLHGENLRRHRQTRRAIIVALAVIGSLAVAATGAAVIANRQRLLALERELTTRVQLLAAQARRFDTPPTTAAQLERAGALALESAHLARAAQRPIEVDALEVAQDVLARLPVSVLRHGDELVNALAQLPDGRLVSAGIDRRIVVWPVGQRGGEPTIFTVDAPVAALATLPDGRIADCQDVPWLPTGSAQPVRQTDCPSTTAAIAFADGRLACGRADGTVTVWPFDGGGSPTVLNHGGMVMSLAVLPDGRLASGGNDGRIVLWPAGGHGAPQVLDSGGSVPALAVLPDGRLVSATDGAGLVKVWPASGQGEPTVFTHGDVVLSLAVLPHGRIASGGDDERIKIWPVGGGEPVVIENGAPATAVLAMADGRLASGGSDGLIRIWHGSGRGEPIVLQHGSEVYSLGVLKDGRLASAGLDSGIRLWPANYRDAPMVLDHGDSIPSLAALADGGLASGGFDD